MDPRLAVVVFPPRAAVEPAEGFRRQHDALFHRIAAHLTVVFPFRSLSPKQARKRIAAVLEEQPVARFRVTVGGAGRYDDGVVFLRVGEGAARLIQLHDRLTEALVPADEPSPLPFLPHLTIGRGTSDAEARFLERQAAGRLPPLAFEVGAVSLVLEDARGLWLEQRRFALERGSAVAPARLLRPA